MNKDGKWHTEFKPFSIQWWLTMYAWTYNLSINGDTSEIHIRYSKLHNWIEQRIISKYGEDEN